MSKKGEKAVAALESTMRTRVAYTAIYRTVDYGGRVIDSEESPSLYENEAECFLDSKDDDQFVAVATVTWEEPA